MLETLRSSALQDQLFHEAVVKELWQRPRTKASRIFIREFVMHLRKLRLELEVIKGAMSEQMDMISSI